MVTRGNALQIAQNQANLREKVYGNVFKLWQRVALWPIHVCRVW